MSHKIKIIDYSFMDDFGVKIVIDGEPLFYEGTYTVNCLDEILRALGVEFEIEFEQQYEEFRLVTKKMKLVPDE